MSNAPVLQLALGLVACSHVVLAGGYSALQARLAGGRGGAPGELPSPPPSVDVIVPCFNERPDLLAACCRSLAGQDYPGAMRVWLVDDGSRNLDQLLPVYHDYQGRAGWTVRLLDGNRGKRLAQNVAFEEGGGELVLTIDSDTVIAPDGVRRIAAPFADPRVGAVAALVLPANRRASWLTRLIHTRYRLLFEQERAAQGRFGAVLCCAGPFSAYRRSALARVWRGYLGQRFRGRTLASGDDLALTNLVLAAGYRSHYQPAARAATDVPVTLRRYFHQQLRWNRSFYRQLPRLRRLLRGRPAFLRVDLTARTLLPALAAGGVVLTAADLARAGASHLVPDLGMAALAATAGLGCAAVQARSLAFAAGYGLVYLGLLLPTRLLALCTLGEVRWGTRQLRRVQLRSSTRSLRTPAAATWLPFSSYIQAARSSSRSASASLPASRRTSARST
jgi:N-acetylglucosaminyltransferase